MQGPSKLIAWRKREGLSQAEAAERVGLKQPTISELERGNCRRITVETALAIESLTGGEVAIADWTDRGSGPLPRLADETGAHAVAVVDDDTS